MNELLCETVSIENRKVKGPFELGQKSTKEVAGGSIAQWRSFGGGAFSLLATGILQQFTSS